MRRLTADIQLLQRVTRNNAEAMDFLANHWSPYVHEVDDIVDGERTKPGDIIATFARAVTVYTHPFFVRNSAALTQLVLNISCAFADSVEWERGSVEWKRDWADHYRHVGMEMVIAVATLCGGYEHARTISQEQREICHFDHHNKKGEPT